MPKPLPPPEGAVLRFFRFSLGLSEEGVAQPNGVTGPTVGRWENGQVRLSREELGQVLSPWKVPPAAIDEALHAHELTHPPYEPPSPTAPREEERVLIDQAAAAGARAAHTELTLEHHREQARHDRLWAEERWTRLARLPAENQEKAVEILLGDEKSWALAERLGTASCAAAAHRASDALRLARLAVRLAEQSPGPESWLLRLRGKCEPYLANALRVAGDLNASEATFASADELWDQGASGDPAGLLDGARRLDLKASFLRQRGRFAEAIDLLDLTLAASPPEAEARLLIKKAVTHTRAGNYELALEVLAQAEPRIDDQRERRLLFLHRFTLGDTLCHLDRYEPAKILVGLVETLAADLGNELDRVRACWLKGKAWAGLARREEALAILSQVRQYFRSKGIAYDFALVSLEVAVLHLEQGRTRLVRELAEEMLWIFEQQKVHKEALAALALFRRAAREEEVESEWTRRLIKYLYRAQHNPGLHFEP